VGPGGYVACAQGVAACIVVQQAGRKPVAGSFGAGDGLGEQPFGASWGDAIAEQLRLGDDLRVCG
jgi:hypothetical protein